MKKESIIISKRLLKAYFAMDIKLSVVQLELFPSTSGTSPNATSISAGRTASVLAESHNLVYKERESPLVVFECIRTTFGHSKSRYRLHASLIDLDSIQSFLKAISRESLSRIIPRYERLPIISKRYLFNK